MNLWLRFSILSLMSVFISVNICVARPPVDDGEVIVSKPSQTTCTDVFNCTLPLEIQATHRFLQDREYGRQYTAEPRNLTPRFEILRLNELSQTLAYLNLAKVTAVPYRLEARQRVDYLASLVGTDIGLVANGPRDGMFGYMFLQAYSTFGDQRYRQLGLEFADRCLLHPEKDMQMNGGLMCALNLAAAYNVSGNEAYRAASRAVTLRTAPKQFLDGSFPHLPTLAGGKNISYTGWKAVELFLLRQLDPTDPNVDLMLVKAVNFLEQRVSSTGALTYENETEIYYSDPGNADSRYFTSELASIAVTLHIASRRSAATRILKFLFSKRLRGEEYGGYTDKYAEIDVSNPWTSGNPSMLRTSLIFWYLSIIRANSGTCSSGASVSCAVSASNCNPLYQSVGLCNSGLPGFKYCLAGQYSSCFNPSATAYVPGQTCITEVTCRDTYMGACYDNCYHYGARLCVDGSTCAADCRDIDAGGQGDVRCETDRCYDGYGCMESPPPSSGDINPREPSPRLDTVE